MIAGEISIAGSTSVDGMSVDGIVWRVDRRCSIEASRAVVRSR
jgi:hypothetical protein